MSEQALQWPSTTSGIPESQAFKVLGVQVNAVQIPDVITRMERWISEASACRFIAVTGMHGVSVSREDAEFASILGDAGLVVADGMPLVWMGRWYWCRSALARISVRYFM